MSFGKRPPRPIAPVAGPDADAEEARPLRHAPAMKVQEKKGGEAGFIALAIGVVIVAGAGAFFLPGLMSPGAKTAVAAPIAKPVAGMPRDEVKAKLANEAFPDPAGHAFMTALATHFPSDHDELLGRLADISLQGGDRDAFAAELDAWTQRFSKAHAKALSRTGAEGWDAVHQSTNDWIGLLETAAPGCTGSQLEAFIADKKAVASALSYGSEGYDDLIAAGRAVVDLAVLGRTAAPVDPTMQADDVRAIRNVLGPASDERILAASVIDRLGDGSNYNPLSDRPDLNLCTLARSGLKQMNMLPGRTKAKLMAGAAY